MKNISFYLLLYGSTYFISMLPVRAQDNELFYFLDPKDSLVGVKNQHGKIIIPPVGSYLFYDPQDSLITDSLVYIFDFDNGNNNYTSNTFGSVYNRKGRFLYHPMAYDNGPDYFQEGLRRIVNNGKAGFANILGDIVIKPQWDWVSPFNYGYARVCNNCYWDMNKDPEHPPLAYKEGAEVFYIDKKGNRVEPLATPCEKCQPIDSAYLPYPFRYKKEERQLTDRMNQLDIISKIYLSNIYNQQAGNMPAIRFEIVETPYTGFPYYIIQGYSYTQQYGFRVEDDYTFFADRDGEIYQQDWLDHHFTPLKTWLVNELKKCADFFNSHTDAPNKFDVAAYLKQYAR